MKSSRWPQEALFEFVWQHEPIPPSVGGAGLGHPSTLRLRSGSNPELVEGFDYGRTERSLPAKQDGGQALRMYLDFV